MAEGNSYRQILRSTSIIGGASVINVVVGLVRMKAAALLLGPTGVGLIGLMNNLLTTASGVAGLGVGTVGTRQIAEAAGHEDPARAWQVRRALFWLTLVLALAGGVAVWLSRELLARRILGGEVGADAVGLLAIGVAVSVAAPSQTALLNGLRRIGDLARVTVGSALLSTLGGLAALWLWGERGIVAFVLAGPIATFLLGHVYVRRLPRVEGSSASLGALAPEWSLMVRLGFAFMVASFAGTAGQLAVQTLVQERLGGEGLGLFQAAWMISMTYIGFVLGAMGTDYYPRLTAVIHDAEATNRLVNEQTEVALLLAAPALIAMMALAPWVLRVLYSDEFLGAAETLRWQVAGDVIKILSWPLGFILLAAGDGKSFMVSQWLAIVAFYGATWSLLPYLALGATGVAFLGMYVLLLVIVRAYATYRFGFEWTSHVAILAFALLASALAIHGVALVAEPLAAVVGLLLAVAFGLYALVRLASLGDLRGPMAKLSRIVPALKSGRGSPRE